MMDKQFVHPYKMIDRIIQFKQLEPIEYKNYIFYDTALNIDNEVDIIDGDNPKKLCDYRMIRGMHYDGTLWHEHDLISEIVLKLLQKNSTMSGYAIAPKSYSIGQFLIGHYDEPQEKSWMKSHIRVQLPVKCNFDIKELND